MKLKSIPLDDLREALSGLPFADEVVSRLEASYRRGTSLGSAFTSFLREVLKGYGLLFLDPLAPAIRKIAAPFLHDVVGRIPELTEGLRERDKALSEDGYHAQVHVEQDTSLMFVIRDGKRIALRYKDGRFLEKERQYSVEELQNMPLQLSPNALLRPVMQDYLLPTISYVGGPSEIAYMAQAEVLYTKLLGRMPVIYPRNSYTLLDAKTSKLLWRYHLRVPDLLGAEEQVKGRIAAKMMSPALADEFRSAQTVFDETLGKLQLSLAAFDSTLEQAACKSASKIRYQLEKMSRKTARETMRRDAGAMSSAEYLRNSIYPHRHLQERFYSIVPFLAKHGMDLPQRLLNEAQLLCPDHIVRAV